MAREWTEATLGDLVEIKHGYAFKGEFFKDEPSNLILMTPGNFAIGGGFKADKLKYYDGPVPEDFVLRRGELIVTMTDLSKNADTLGFPAFVPEPLRGERYLHNQRIGKVIVKHKARVDLGFLHYLMCSREYRHEVVASATGTTVKHTSPERIKKFRFQLPPLPEQGAIAHILGSLDDKIKLNRRMNETLEAMARALFKSWFVDFDPVRAKIEGRNPGIPKHIADLFPARLVDSGLAEIPEGWNVRKLRDFACVDKGLSYKGEGLADEGGLPMVNLGCFAGNGVFKPENIKRYLGEYRERHIVNAGDLLIANTDMTQKRIILGSPALIPALEGESRFLFTHHTFAVRFLTGAEQWRRYIYFSLLQPKFREISEGYATGTTVLALPQTGVLEYPVTQPPEPILNVFEHQSRALQEAVDINLKRSNTLIALRDKLLPKLISGDLRVKNAERIAGAAL